MMSRFDPVLTQAFYEWEVRGRGWQQFDDPIDIEPPYEPPFLRLKSPKVIDDGLQETLFTKVTGAIKSFLTTAEPEEVEEDELPPLEPFPSRYGGPKHVLAITLPDSISPTTAEFEQCLTLLSGIQDCVSFEILANSHEVKLQFVCGAPDLAYVQSVLKSCFPDCGIVDTGTELLGFVDDDKCYSIFDLALAEEFMRPLRMPGKGEIDPYVGLFGILDNLSGAEQTFIQIIFQGTVNTWAQGILSSVATEHEDSLFQDVPEMITLAKEKIAAPLFSVILRVIGQGTTFEEANDVAARVVQTLQHITKSHSNCLIPVDIPKERGNDLLIDIVFRQARKYGMLLNSRELSNLAHLPSRTVHSTKLNRQVKKTKAVPPVAVGHMHVLGENIHQGNSYQVSLSSEQRLRHTHVIGATGTGKSSFLLSNIVQDITSHNGVAVLDPHGDLIENILPWIPEHRIKDVIVIDPSDSEYPVGFNILTAHSEIEKDILSSDLVAVFRRLSTSWGDQMNSVFANAILAFLESSTGGTLMDLRRFLIEKPFRDQFLKTVTDPSITYYWQREFPLLKSSSIGPILTRLDTFLRPKLIRNMVAQKKSLDFENILDTQKILLVKLSQGLIGAENSYLLGTFIVAKIQQAAMARQAKAKESRADYFLYIDEFQNFITPSMATILSGARKYHLGLILAHQDMQQLLRQDTELASSVISNAGTRICFRLGDIDAKRMADGFSSFEALDLQNLGVGQAICRIDRPEYDFNLSTVPLQESDTYSARQIIDSVLSVSRQTYGTPRSEIEEILREVQVVQYEPASAEPIRRSQENPLKTSVEPIELPHKPDISKVPSRHRYIQTLIKKMAESRGFVVSIEQPTPDEKGRVDVGLERNEKKIAVEIQDTTKDEWELQNIEKCLSAGYDLVVECSKEQRAVSRLKKKVEETFGAEELKRILVMTPEEFFLFIDTEIAKEASGETRIKGYRVKTEFNAVPDDEAQRMREAIAKSVLRSGKDKKP